MANKDIFGLDKKKRRKGEPDVPEIRPIRYRVDPFNIMSGDIERVKAQTNAERNPLEVPGEMPNNEVSAPADGIRKKKEEE